MYYGGVDLHKCSALVNVIDERGQALETKRAACVEREAIQAFFRTVCPFKAVIEPSSSYRWLHNLTNTSGQVVMAHSLRLRAIVSGRAKADKFDSEMLARLLRANLIPTAYIPPERYQRLRAYSGAPLPADG